MDAVVLSLISLPLSFAITRVRFSNFAPRAEANWERAFGSQIRNLEIIEPDASDYAKTAARLSISNSERPMIVCN